MRYLFLCLLCLGVGSAYAAAPGGDVLAKAINQVEQAIAQGETSLGAHQPGSGWTKRHMQEVINLIEASNAVNAGILNALKHIKGNLNPDAAVGVDAALAYLQAAAEHAHRSVQAKSVDATHAEARLATGLLVAARGVTGATSPVTGALEYAQQHQ